VIIRGHIVRRTSVEATVRLSERDWRRAGEPREVRLGGRAVRCHRGLRQPGGELDIELVAVVDSHVVELVVPVFVRDDGAIQGQARGVSGKDLLVEVRTADYHSSDLAPGCSTIVQGPLYDGGTTYLAGVSFRGAVSTLSLPVKDPVSMLGLTVWLRRGDQSESRAA